MEFGLSEEQVMLTDSVGRFLSDQVPLARVRRFAEQREGRADDVLDGLRGLGIPGLVIDEAYGGVGLTLLDAALVAEVLGAHVACAPFTASAVIAPLAIALAGSEAQKQEWLAPMAAGERLVGSALGTDGVREDARVTSRDGHLSGKSLFVLDFEADAYVVADRDGGLFLIDAAAPGVTRERLTTIDRTRRLGELRFQDAAALPLRGATPRLLETLLDAGRVMLAADTLGAAQQMLDAAVEYAGQRRQFGRVIGSFQAVKHLCADMAAALTPCRSMVWYAAHVLDAVPDEAHVTACHTKAHVTEVGTFVAKTATEVHGGMGFTDLLGLHYWFKRIGVNRQLLGSPSRLREAAARAQGLA